MKITLVISSLSCGGAERVLVSIFGEWRITFGLGAIVAEWEILMQEVIGEKIK